MAPFLPERVDKDSTRFNYFHEYDDDNEELFEVREITPPPSPTPEQIIPATPTSRVGKIRNVLNRVGSRRKARGGTVRSQGKKEGEWGGGRHATLPRIKKEVREAQLKDLRDQMFGLGMYY